MSSGEIVSEGQASRTFVGLSLALGILISGLPGAASAAGPVTSAPNAVSAAAKRGVRATTDRGRTYIVTLRVSHAGEAIPASRSGRQRIHARAAQTRAETDRLLRDYEVQPRHRYTAAVAGFSAQMSAEQAAALAGDPAVADIHVARRIYLASEPQVVQRALRRVNGAPDDLGSSGPVDVDIAIMDTGIGPAPDELDVQGGVNCAGDGRATDWWYDSGWFQHGTHVAGLAAAKDNDIGIVGAAPGARLWSIRVFDDTGYGTEDAILCGLDWATRTVTEPYHGTTQPVEVLNMSLEARRGPGAEACTVGDTDLIHRAVCQAAAAGITIVVAAGNVGGARNDRDASKVIPARYDQVITVGAINDYDGKGGGLAADTCVPDRDPTTSTPATAMRALTWTSWRLAPARGRRNPERTATSLVMVSPTAPATRSSCPARRRRHRSSRASWLATWPNTRAPRRRRSGACSVPPAASTGTAGRTPTGPASTTPTPRTACWTPPPCLALTTCGCGSRRAPSA